MESECITGKKRFNTKKLAQTSLNIIARNSHKEHYPVRSYYYELCKGHHLTSNPENKESGRVRPVVLTYAKKFRQLISKNK